MVFRIKVSGALDQSWSDWLGQAKIIPEPQNDGSVITTLIVDLVDQSVLFGILDRLRDLNLNLVNVARDEAEAGR